MGGVLTDMRWHHSVPLWDEVHTGSDVDSLTTFLRAVLHRWCHLGEHAISTLWLHRPSSSEWKQEGHLNNREDAH